jgi:hypothetical protein
MVSPPPLPKLTVLLHPHRAGNDLIDFDGDQSQTSGGPKSDAVALEELFGGMSPPPVTSNPAQPPRQAISLGTASLPQTSSRSFPFTSPITPAQSQSLWNNNALMSGSGVVQPAPPSPAFDIPVSVRGGSVHLPLSAGGAGLPLQTSASPASSPAVQPTSSAVSTKKDPFADLEGLF